MQRFVIYLCTTTQTHVYLPCVLCGTHTSDYFLRALLKKKSLNLFKPRAKVKKF